MIEELVNQDQNTMTAVYTSFPGTDKTKLDALVNFIKVFLEANVTLSDFNNFHAVESSYKKELVCQILC